MQPKSKPESGDAFKRETLTDYSTMRTRFGPKYNLANELTKPGRELPFTLADYREWVYLQLQSARGLRCAYCDKNLTVKLMSPDHVLPVKRGGGLGLDNIAAACKDCNTLKGQLTGPEFFALMQWTEENLVKAARNYLLGCMRSAAMGSRMRFFPRDKVGAKPKAAKAAPPFDLFTETF